MTSSMATPATNSATSAANPSPRLRLHRMRLSGHCHRVELFLSLLGLPFEAIDVDLASGEHKTPAFLALNPLGQVPVLQDGELTLADSNAILVYLARRYAGAEWWPQDPLQQARLQRWFSIAAGPLAQGAAAARAIVLFKRPLPPEGPIATAHALLAVMEAHLQGQSWLLGHQVSLADLALYSYTEAAPEGRVSLQAYPAVQQWLRRVEALPGFLPMPRSSVGLRA